MNGENNQHHRHSIRLKGYDYSEEGAYFVTVVTQHREMLFGKVVEGAMVLNELGEIVKEEWLKTTSIRMEIEIDIEEFVVMPNHIHGIIHITKNNDDPGRGDRPVAPTKAHGPIPKSLGALISGYKSAVTVRINQIRGTPGYPVWQRSYYDHIIRDEKDYNTIANYIAMNPSNWEEDGENH